MEINQRVLLALPLEHLSLPGYPSRPQSLRAHYLNNILGKQSMALWHPAYSATGEGTSLQWPVNEMPGNRRHSSCERYYYVVTTS